MRALVTGAATGLGRELVRQLLASGCLVTAVDREEMADEPGLQPLVADLADRHAVDQLIEQLCSGGAFDWVVHNAGVSATGRFENLPEDAYRRLLTVNCETPLVLTGRLAAADRLARGGRVIFVSSLSHATGYPGGTVYAASKDALTVYAKSIRRSLAKRGVGVMTVFPGPLRTEHAARHAPSGNRAESRMEPSVAAARIIHGARRGDRSLYPGSLARVGRLAGALLPYATTRLMRRLIFERLERDVY